MNIILGAGLAGLCSAYILSRHGEKAVIIEKEGHVGGLSRTIRHGDFRFDLGGHRFITHNRETERFVKEILEGDYLTVPRKSRIYMKGRFFDYPLKPVNAVSGLGVVATFQIVSDYFHTAAMSRIKKPDIVSLEDWVVNRFGRKMFELYFKEYSEKVWGTDCKNISCDWVAQRIKGLSMWEAIKNSFFKFSGKQIDTLADQFIYPRLGIGQIAENLKGKVEVDNQVLTGTAVTRIYHEDFRIRSVCVTNNQGDSDLQSEQLISSVPLTGLVGMLRPAPPDYVFEAAGRLRYRDLIVVTVMIDRQRVTDLSWMYLPEKDIPIGRIHEPKNWSPSMAPEGKTHIVAEYFASKNDRLWAMPDDRLSEMTVRSLAGPGFIREDEVIDSCVVRITNAYPVLDIGYKENQDIIFAYLKNFKNLHLIGRVGTFRYFNIDHAIESGINAANAIVETRKNNASMALIKT